MILSPFETVYVALCADGSGDGMTISTPDGREGIICYRKPEGFQDLPEYTEDPSAYIVTPRQFGRIVAVSPLVLLDGKLYEFEFTQMRVQVQPIQGRVLN
jgi:hypothetical protein